MEDKVFAFHGMEFRQLFVFIIILVLVALLGFFLPIFIMESVLGPSLPTLFALIFGGSFAILFGKFAKKLWTVKITKELLEIYFGNSLKAKFLLADLEKIQVRGWNRKKTYRILRLFTDQQKVTIFVDNTGGITNNYEMEIFEECRIFLELYAKENDYKKIELRKESAQPDFINYALQKR